MAVIGLVIGDIETGTLEDYRHGREDAPRLAFAGGAKGGAFIGEAALLLELA